MATSAISPMSSAAASPATSNTLPTLPILDLPKGPHRRHISPSSLVCLAGSPLTPRPRRASATPQTPPRLIDAEAETLAMMLAHVARRKAARTALVSSTVAVGNVAFINDRHVLVEWMIDVCKVFGFMPTTLHTAVRHVDWFMARRRLPQNVWQLCAVACVFIAAKCEEQAEAVPLLSELQHVCGDAYEAAVVKRMEVLVLEVLEWDPIDRGAVHFLFFNLRTVQRLVGASSPRSHKRSRVDAGLEMSAAPAAKLLKTQSSADAIEESPAAEKDEEEHRDEAASLLECRSPVSDVWSEDVADLVPPPVDYLTHYLTGATLSYGQTAAAVLDQVLYDPALCATQNPQHIAAAALYVARQSAGVAPAWPLEYQAATGLAEREFSEQAALLTSVFDAAAADLVARETRCDAGEAL